LHSIKARPIFAPPKEKGAPNKVLVAKFEGKKQVSEHIRF
jgi:hypothetical protein